MASYSPISNTEVDPESPITASLMIRLRDNPLAIQEGDGTAPKILGAALANLAVTAAKIANQTITQGQIAPETITGGVGGNVAPGTLTGYNMDPASAGYLFDADGGWASLVSEVKLQWLKIPVIAADDSTTLTWKVPFTTSVGFAIAGIETPNQTFTIDNAMHVVSGYTLTQITVRNEAMVGSTSAGGWVFAVGL